MCTEKQLPSVIKDVSQGMKDIFGDKLRSLLLYGSYARGDYDEYSDIDIFALIDVPQTAIAEYRKPVSKISSRTGLKSDTVVSITLYDYESFLNLQDILPFLQNVQKDGVDLLAG